LIFPKIIKSKIVHNLLFLVSVKFDVVNLVKKITNQTFVVENSVKNREIVGIIT